MTETLVEVVIIGVLIAANAVFVLAETALVTVRRSRVEQLVEEGRPAARRVRSLLEDPARYLAVVQVAITFIGFLAAAYAGVSLARALATSLEKIPLSPGVAEAVALLIVTALVALATVVLGELVPKTLALTNPERYALRLSRPVSILNRVLGPLVSLLSWLTALVARPLGGRPGRDTEISAEELKMIVARGGDQGILEAEEEQMINAVIELGERRLHEVMRPRIDIVALPVTATVETAIDTIIEEGHSRIPVYEGTIDQVVGILYAKDLLPVLKSGAVPRPPLRGLLRSPLFVPESMSIDDLLHAFQRRKVHAAIVLDEYGGTAGLVTIEDLLEEIVGEIQDEYDVEEPMVVRLSPDQARVDGRASVDDLGDTFEMEIELEDREEYDTVGGLVYHRIGGVPRPGDRIELEGLVLTVESTDGRRVGKVLAVRMREGREPVESSPDEGER